MNRTQEYKFCRIAIWAFFFLLIFEGAFRKWILPSLSDLFLVIRDPLAIYVAWVACKLGLWRNRFVTVSWLIGFVAFVISLLFGHQNLLIALYGVRVWVYYFPFILAVPMFLPVADIIKMCKYTLYITVGMAVLLCLQYFTPQSSIFNIGVGGEGSSGFTGVGEYFRPSGTFSFNAALLPYMLWAVCSLFVGFFYKFKQSEAPSIYVWSLSFLCFLVCIPVSLSRGVVAGTTIFFIWMLLIMIWHRRHKRALIKLFACLFVFLPLLLSNRHVQVAISNMERRFEEASRSEGDFVKGSMVQRNIVYVLDELLESEDVPFFYGSGIGMSTNVAATLFTGGKSFLTREGGSDLMENGYLIGSIMFFYKWALLFYIAMRCVRVRRYSLLPLFFLITVLLIRPGAAGQNPSAVGFSSFLAAVTLTLAAKTKKQEGRNLSQKAV